MVEGVLGLSEFGACCIPSSSNPHLLYYTHILSCPSPLRIVQVDVSGMFIASHLKPVLFPFGLNLLFVFLSWEILGSLK